jgi:hypothetical protein
VRDALAKLGKVETLLGTFSFTAAREPRYTPVVLVVREGRFVPYR